MKRQSIVAAIAIVVLAVVVGLVLRRNAGRSPSDAGSGQLAAARIFVDDSLGVRMRLPESPGWTLTSDAAGRPDGRRVSAVHKSENGIVRIFAQPVGPETTLDTVFEARQRQFATAFNVPKLDAILARVLHDEKRDVNGRIIRQWQAQTKPGAGTDEAPTNIIFMWLQTVDSKRSLECIGLVRAPVQPTPAQRASADSLLQDVAYILGSFEVR